MIFLSDEAPLTNNCRTFILNRCPAVVCCLQTLISLLSIEDRIINNCLVVVYRPKLTLLSTEDSLSILNIVLLYCA